MCASFSREVRRAAAVLALSTAACTNLPLPEILDPAPEPGEIIESLFLIGDAGVPDPRGEPVLIALRSELFSSDVVSTAVFLGDNVYPAGLPPETAPDRERSERRLEAQLYAVRATGARGIFMPGNHDWNFAAGGDPEYVLRQEAFVLERGGDEFLYLPGGACPGPAVYEGGERFRLVVLDSYWWVAGARTLLDPGSQCGARTEDAVLDSLGRVIADAGERVVVVAAHHPIATTGSHGGYFPAMDHAFPLRNLHPALWLPLPFIGSLYPFARARGISDQDLPSGRYSTYIATLDSLFQQHPIAIYAAGHDHNIQIMDGGDAVPRIIVSGAGNFAHSAAVGTGSRTRFAAAQGGYVRVDALADGSVLVSVVLVNADASRRVAYRERLGGS